MEAALESCVPPGFRFHPTEEELLGYYLSRKISSQKTDLQVIVDIDLYRIEPWDLQDRCKHGYEEQNEWYFFSHKDKKYPTGTRTNRATTAGFWKATGRDKAVLSRARIIGMRKTLVFYVGRAPNGRKTDWIIHEYRLQSSEHEPTQEEGWVVCRAFKKQIPNQRPCFNTFNPNCCIKDYEQFRSDTHTDATRTSRFVDSCFDNNVIDYQTVLLGTAELESRQIMYNHIFDIPRLDSPDLSTSLATKECFEANPMAASQISKDCAGQFIDWKALDKLLASQVSLLRAQMCMLLFQIMMQMHRTKTNSLPHFIAYSNFKSRKWFISNNNWLNGEP